MPDLDLDVVAPDQVSKILRDAADSYLSDASDLDAAWQDKSAGRPWRLIAKVLEQAADRIDEKL